VTNAQIVAVGIRLFCIWLAVYLFRDVPALWSARKGQFLDVGAVVVVAVVVAVVLIALWMFPLTVAGKLLPKAALNEPSQLPVDQVERAGFCLLGLWMLTEAIPSLFYYAVMVYEYARPDVRPELRAENVAGLLHTAVQLGLGIWLLFGARGLLGLIRWARTAGIPEPSNSVVESDARQEQPRAPHHERSTA
jgi:hypothetical protein